MFAGVLPFAAIRAVQIAKLMRVNFTVYFAANAE